MRPSWQPRHPWRVVNGAVGEMTDAVEVEAPVEEITEVAIPVEEPADRAVQGFGKA